jgi:hypothetical protein
VFKAEATTGTKSFPLEEDAISNIFWSTSGDILLIISPAHVWRNHTKSEAIWSILWSSSGHLVDHIWGSLKRTCQETSLQLMSRFETRKILTSLKDLCRWLTYSNIPNRSLMHSNISTTRRQLFFFLLWQWRWALDVAAQEDRVRVIPQGVWWRIFLREIITFSIWAEITTLFSFPLWIKDQVTIYFKIYFLSKRFIIIIFLRDCTWNKFQVAYVPLWIKDQVIT